MHKNSLKKAILLVNQAISFLNHQVISQNFNYKFKTLINTLKSPRLHFKVSKYVKTPSYAGNTKNYQITISKSLTSGQANKDSMQDVTWDASQDVS